MVDGPALGAGIVVDGAKSVAGIVFGVLAQPGSQRGVRIIRCPRGGEVKAGQIYVAQLSPAEGDDLLGSALGMGGRFAMSENTKDPARLPDLADRLCQYFSHHQIHHIVLVEVRKRADWKYSDAYTHVMTVA